MAQLEAMNMNGMKCLQEWPHWLLNGVRQLCTKEDIPHLEVRMDNANTEISKRTDSVNSNVLNANPEITM